jgi:hypothetical protein
MDTFKEFLVSFAVIGLFIFAILTFAVNFQLENQTSIGLMTDSRMNDTYNDINENLNDLNLEAIKQMNNTENAELEQGVDYFSIASIWGSFKKFASNIKGVSNILGNSMRNYIGIDPLVIAFIFSIVLISLVFLGWKLLRVGE